jgi:DNA processing protein
MSYQTNSELVNTPWSDSRLGWLGLAWFEKFGPASLAKLARYYGNDGGQKAWLANAKELTDLGINEKSAKDFCIWREKQDPENLKRLLTKTGIDFILPWDKNYPSIFRESHNPPGALFWRGALLDNRPWIAVVGTRKMSAYGERAVKIIVRGLIEKGAGIISGLALGIDGAAHKAALENNGKTIAVLGSGIDSPSIYPAAHQNLGEQILLSGGALISEYPPKTPGLKHHFPQRNRIIASLAQATVVVEADLNSGSVLTAKNALESNRDVFAVPGPITSPISRGAHALIRQGATICESADDILNSPIPEQNTTSTFKRELTMDEGNILNLCITPTHIDDLARHLNTSAAHITATCMHLELDNILTDTGGQTYEITPAGRNLLKLR